MILRELHWLEATPLQEPADAAFISARAGTGSSRQFAAFARRYQRLFQTHCIGGGRKGTRLTYRLSEEGRDVLESARL